MKENTCCFTGHRNIPKDEIPLIKERLKETIIELINHGVIYYGSGGALGFDTLAALTVIELKKQYPQIKLILVLPCKNQTRYWKPKDIKTFLTIKTKADKIVYTSQIYFNGCMQKRNRHLVDNSNYCIAFCTKSSGGTAYTLDYAKQKKINIINLAPLKEPQPMNNLQIALKELEEEWFASLPDFDDVPTFEVSEKHKKWEQQVIYGKKKKSPNTIENNKRRRGLCGSLR